MGKYKVKISYSYEYEIEADGKNKQEASVNGLALFYAMDRSMAYTGEGISSITAVEQKPAEAPAKAPLKDPRD